MVTKTVCFGLRVSSYKMVKTKMEDQSQYIRIGTFFHKLKQTESLYSDSRILNSEIIHPESKKSHKGRIRVLVKQRWN